MLLAAAQIEHAVERGRRPGREHPSLSGAGNAGFDVDVAQVALDDVGALNVSVAAHLEAQLGTARQRGIALEAAFVARTHLVVVAGHARAALGPPPPQIQLLDLDELLARRHLEPPGAMDARPTRSEPMPAPAP